MMRRLASIGIAALVLAGCSSTPEPKAGADSPWRDQVETSTGLSQEHTPERVDYPTRPPAGGKHSPQWQNCGLFSEPVADEAAVHSLEHGAAWFTWQGALSQQQRSFIAQLADGNEWILASPYPEQPAPFVLTAWGLQLKLNDFNREAIEWFLTTYANGEQTLEPGAPCMQGINTTR